MPASWLAVGAPVPRHPMPPHGGGSRCGRAWIGLAGWTDRAGAQLSAGYGIGIPPAGCDSPRSNARTSDSRNLRCPPGVRMLLMRPDAAHRVTVFGSTRNSAATSPGVRRRSLLPSTDLPSLLRFRSMSSVSRKHPFTSLFSPKMSRWVPCQLRACTTDRPHLVPLRSCSRVGSMAGSRLVRRRRSSGRPRRGRR